MTAKIENGVLYIGVPLYATPEVSGSGKSRIVAKEAAPNLMIPGFALNGKPAPVTVQLTAFCTIPKAEREGAEPDKTKWQKQASMANPQPAAAK